LEIDVHVVFLANNHYFALFIFPFC